MKEAYDLTDWNSLRTKANFLQFGKTQYQDIGKIIIQCCDNSDKIEAITNYVNLFLTKTSTLRANLIAKKFNHELSYEYGLTGATAIDQVGAPYPAKTHELCMKSDAVL